VPARPCFIGSLLLTAAGYGTAEIMRATGKAKTVIWRWLERFQDEGRAGLWRDKTRSLPARRAFAGCCGSPLPTSSALRSTALN
jgi:hypothetical protein